MICHLEKNFFLHSLHRVCVSKTTSVLIIIYKQTGEEGANCKINREIN